MKRSNLKPTFFRLLLYILIFSTGMVHAEGNCPNGYYPIGAAQGQQGPQGCAPIPGYDQQSAQLPSPTGWAPLRESRWGAVATDIAHSSAGASVDKPTKREAEKAALAECKSNGGLACKVELTYENGCVAMSVGNKIHNVTSDATIKIASQSSMETCKSADTNCRIYYTACSLPVLVH